MDVDASTRTSNRVCPPDADPVYGGGARAYAASPSSAPPADGGGNGHARPDPQESVHRLTSLLAEYKEYVAYYLGARIDSVKGSVRNLGIYAGLGIVGLIAFSAFVTTTVVLFLVGIALGVNRLTDSLWIGPFVVGAVFLALIGGGIVFGSKKLMNSFRTATVNKYEQRQNWERGQFGRTVAEQAAASHDQ
jgi:hypothetical protein